MTQPFQFLDLSTARNVWVVGDIHGCFSMMEEKLAKLDFDPALDHVVSVGDLIDRGPECDRAVEFCNKPWFHWVRGNHEELFHLYASNAQHYGKKQFIRNGGMWATDKDATELDLIDATINDAPVIMEVLSPSGKRYGIVHACFPSDDWRHAEAIANNPEAVQLCLWDRTDVHSPKPQGIRGIDRVFHGHTPLGDARTVANVAWIDTGAYRDGGKMTMAKLI